MYLISLLFMGTLQSSLVTFHSFASSNRLTLVCWCLVVPYCLRLGTWMDITRGAETLLWEKNKQKKNLNVECLTFLTHSSYAC